jgi:hypothetical protein
LGKREIVLEVVLGGIFTLFITIFQDPLKSIFNNLLSPQEIPTGVVAILGLIGVIGLTVITVLLILRLINYRKNKDPRIMIIQATPKSNIDDLIKKIEDFTIKWQEGVGVNSGYRKWVENNWFVGDKNQIRKFIKHGDEIHSKINRVKKVRIYELDNALNGLTEVTDRLVKLLAEIKRVYWNMDKSKVILASDPNIPKQIISDGDKICEDFESAVYQLHLLSRYYS